MIEADLSALIRRQIDLAYDTADQKEYQSGAAYPMRRLATVLPDGTIVWNQKHCRTLVLLSDWLGFRYVADHVYAWTIEAWKKHDNMLYEWLRN